MKIKNIDAGGGVVFRKNINNSVDVLLIYRNGVWDLPKGKIEKGETYEECARREVMEEVNAKELPRISQPLIHTFHTYEERKKEIHKTTYWFSMEFEHEQFFEPQLEEGITKVQWLDLETAIQEVGYQNLKDVLEDFKQKLEV